LTGRESLDVPVAVPRRVAVIGAGPSGLEAACTAAERGSDVVLYERGERIGGLFAVAGSYPGKIGGGRLIDHYARRLEESGVELRLGTEVERLADLGPVDAVIVATGSVPTHSPWPERDPRWGEQWHDERMFTGTWAELRDLDVRGRRVVLHESEMVDFVAMTLAGHLIDAGADLIVVTTFERMGSRLDRASNDTLNRRLAEAEVPVYAQSTLDLDDGPVAVRHRGLHQRIVLEDVDRVISTGPRVPVLPGGLEPAARAAGIEVRRAGDCLAPRAMGTAVAEGYRAAVELTSA